MQLVHLTQGMTAEVDDEDAPLVFSIKWHAVRARHTSYAAGRVDGRTVYMHRFLLGVDRGLHVDHIDRNGLNNRRQNLRACTPAENSRRRIAPKDGLGLRGVWVKGNRFVAQIGHGGKFLYLGSFGTAAEASAAYQAAAAKLFGAFAPGAR